MLKNTNTLKTTLLISYLFTSLIFSDASFAQSVNYTFNGGPTATFTDGSQLSGTVTINYAGTGSSAVTAANLTLSSPNGSSFALSNVGGGSGFYNAVTCGTSQRVYETALIAGSTRMYLDTVAGSSELIPGSTGTYSSLNYGGATYKLMSQCGSGGGGLASLAAASQYSNMTKNAAVVAEAKPSVFNTSALTGSAIPRLVNTITSNLTLFTNSIGSIIQKRMAERAAQKAQAAAVKAVEQQAASIRKAAEAKAKLALEAYRQKLKSSGQEAMSPEMEASYLKNRTAGEIGIATQLAARAAGLSPKQAFEMRQAASKNYRNGKSSGDQDDLIAEDDFSEDAGNRDVWVQPFASFARQNQLNNISPYTANTAGIAVGYDKKIDDDWKLGGYFTYANNTTTSTITDASNSMVTNMYQLGAYGQYNIAEESNVQFTAGLGVNQNSGSRITPDNSTATARYNSFPVNLGLSLNHSIELAESTSFSPTLSANWMSITNNQINEAGAGVWNLRTQANNTNQLVFNLLGKLTHEFNDEWSVNATLGGGYAAVNPSMTLVSAYAGSPTSTFISTGNSSAPWMANGGLGVKYATEEGHEFLLNYDALVRERFVNQTASLKFKYVF